MTEGYTQVKIFNADRASSYYVYIHKRASDGKPFYVGKGNKYRAWVTKGRNNWWEKVVLKHGFTVEIVYEKLTEEEAFQCEKDVILEFNYFGYPLVNLTTGGEGGSNPSIETRIKQSRAKVGKYKGLDNPYSDKKTYKFYNKSIDIKETLTRSELCSKYKIPPSQIKKLFGIKPRRTVYGWELKEL